VSQTDAATAQRPTPPAGEFLGHPKALWQLFNIEMWERFAFYGMRALLAVYVATRFYANLDQAAANSQASLVYGGYTALVYATGIAGGYVADRILGYQRSILLGALIMASGLFVLLIEDLHWFLVGLALVVAGNGLFKPNISSMVGKLYTPGDVRRDSGFTIFYMGINLGAFVAPMITSAWIGATWGLKYGFAAAGAGMILSTLFLQIAKGSLGDVGRPEPGKESWSRFFLVGLAALGIAVVVYFLLTASTVLGYLLVAIMLGLAVYFIVSGIRKGTVQLQRYIAMLLLFIANACFWALFEQAGSSMNFFAREHTTPMYGSMENWLEGGFGIFQSLNPLYILLFAPLFAALWPKLDKVGLNPSIPRKFSLGLIQVSLGFFVLAFAAEHFQNAAGLVPWFFLALCYLLHTTGELCLSPIGLSMVTKLADEHEVGLAMGGWFLSIAMAQYVAGLIAAIASGGGGHGEEAFSGIAQYADVYMQLFKLGLGFGVVYLVAAPAINKLMHGVK